jgi:hypothetical protein
MMLRVALLIASLIVNKFAAAGLSAADHAAV